MLNVQDLIDDTNRFATAGHIDPVSGLAKDNVFLYSGTRDTG